MIKALTSSLSFLRSKIVQIAIALAVILGVLLKARIEIHKGGYDEAVREIATQDATNAKQIRERAAEVIPPVPRHRPYTHGDLSGLRTDELRTADPRGFRD